MGGQGARPNIVALLGVPGSGKSIIARRLLEAHGFDRYRFTDPIRHMLAAGFGVSDDDLDGPMRKEPQERLGNCSADHLFRTLVQRWARELVHGRILALRYGERVAIAAGLILTDDLIRPAEADAVRAAGGIIVRITRPGYQPADPGALDRQSGIEHDIEIVNDGSREQLVEKADQFVAQLQRALKKVA